MSAFAAVMTGMGTGAIATIQIRGESAKAGLEKIFRPAADFTAGKILVGKIVDGNLAIDQVTIGCEKPDTFAINCHGNPLIVEQIMQLLQRHGVELVTAEQFLCKTFAGGNTIALEAKLNLPKAKTIEGTKIILNQINSGLTAFAEKWRKNPPSKINNEAKKIIERSRTSRLIIFGCRIVLAGPPNTGKSTLLNLLAGREKAIVTDTKGTTRDWVSAECKIGPIAVELIDTAGLDEKLADDIDKAAQQAAIERVHQADLVLLVLDNSEPNCWLSEMLIKTIAGKKVLTVVNKSDLPAQFDIADLPVNLAQNVVRISALSGTGLDTLAEKIREVTGVKNFDPQQPICFTARQEQVLRRLSDVESKDNSQPVITELLSGPPNV